MTAGPPVVPGPDGRSAENRMNTSRGAAAARVSGDRMDVAAFVAGFSIEVMPRTAAKIADFRKVLPTGTRVYVANIEGTPFRDMLETTQRLVREGFIAVPHITARTVRDARELREMVERYRLEAGVGEVLLLAGGAVRPRGEFRSSVELLESSVFDRTGFRRIFVAGHPEGNRDIDADGGHTELDRALLQKQEFAVRHGIDMELTTQFAFDSAAVIAWTQRIREMGVKLPVNVGVAGPTKLQTLLKFALSCGVGPSIQVIQKRARDVTKLLTPFTPDDVVSGLAEFSRTNPGSGISGLHVFPLGGIGAAATWAADRSAAMFNIGKREHDQ